MVNESNIILTESDFYKLTSLIKGAPEEIAEQLEEELGRASIVASDALPPDAVSMNSTVSFVDLDSGKESTLTLVFPHEANLEENKISVLAPVGAALIGLRVGQVINWPLPNGKKKRMRLASVISQPEAEAVTSK